MRFTQIFFIALILLLTDATINDFNWTESKIARMNQQIVLEAKKLRQLQIALITEGKTGHLLAFAIIAFTIKIIVIIGIIFALHAYWMHYDNYDIKNSKDIFYEHWISETKCEEEMNAIATIDFTYQDYRKRKQINDELSNSTLIKLPIYFGYIHLCLNFIVTICTLHATIWWNFSLQPVPFILLNFCYYDLKLNQRCDKPLSNEYPLIVNNDLKLMVEEVQKGFSNYLSVLNNRPQKLKWTMLSVCASYILLLTVTFGSALNSFFRQIISAKSNEWTINRFQQRFYLFLDVISVTIIIILYSGIYMEHNSMNKFNSELKECREQLNWSFC